MFNLARVGMAQESGLTFIRVDRIASSFGTLDIDIDKLSILDSSYANKHKLLADMMMIAHMYLKGQGLVLDASRP